MVSDTLLLHHESFPEESYLWNQLRFKLIMNLSILVYLLVPQFKGKKTGAEFKIIDNAIYSHKNINSHDGIFNAITKQGTARQ